MHNVSKGISLILLPYIKIQIQSAIEQLYILLMGGCVEPQVNSSAVVDLQIKEDENVQYVPPPRNDFLFQPDPNAGLVPLPKAENFFQQAQTQLQSAPVSSAQQGLLNKQPNNPAQDKSQLLKNIDFINFQVQGANIQYYGEIKVKNPAVSIISSNGVTIMGSSKYGNGRVVAFGSEVIIKESNLRNDKCTVLLLRNAIKWLTKNKQNSSKSPYKVAIFGIKQLYPYSQLIQLADLFVDFSFISDLTNLSPYDSVIIGQLLIDDFTAQISQNLQNYVANGGGILTYLKGWVYSAYGQGKKCKDWKRECPHNILLSPMGIEIGDSHAPLKNLSFNCNEKFQLKKPNKRQYKNNKVLSSGNNNEMKEGEPEEQEPWAFLTDYNYIVDGIQSISYGNAAISSFTYPEDSFFSILEVDQNALMIAGFYGNGKILAFGHPDLFLNKSDSNSQLLTNTLSWMCGEKSNYNIGLFMNVQWNDLILKSIGISAKFETITNQNQINGKDVILVNFYGNWPQQLNQKMLQKLKSYVQKGGNIIFASHGWVWGIYGQGSKNKSLSYDENFASAKILSLFDIGLGKDYHKIQSQYQVIHYEDPAQQNVQQPKQQTNSKGSALEDFLKDDLLKVLKGAKSFKSNDSQVSQNLNKIKSGESFSNICSIETYHQLVDAFVDSQFDIEKNYDKIPLNNAFFNTVYDFMNSLSYACPAEHCRALPPSLNLYPGYAMKKLDKKVIQVYKNRNKRVYTGLYINPGEAVKIKHEINANQLVDVQLKINHNHDLTGRDNGKLKRYPNISRIVKIKSKQFTFASPHGGIIYFEVSKKSDSSVPLKFEFYGAYEAPYFNEERHSAQDFKNIQKIDAPYFVFETKRIVIIGRTKKIFKTLDVKVEKLCSYWNNVINIVKQFRGTDPYPFQKDGIFSDIQLMLGYMHSGNPVHTHQDVTFQLMACGRDITKLGNWGIYHEFGHNHQDYKWTTRGLVEVSNNICSLYCFWRLHNQPVFKSSWLFNKPDEILKSFNRHIALSDGSKLANYDADPALGLYLFAILIDEFSFDVFRNLHRKYDKLNVSPRNDVEKYEILVEQLSLVMGYDMWPYLKKWGFPITEASHKKTSNLKPYKCKRHPNLTP